MRSLKVYYPDAQTGVLKMRLSNLHPEQCLMEQVLLEKITKLLLTRVGSNRYNQDYGTGLGNKNSWGNSLTRPQVELMIHQAVTDVERIILNEQSTENNSSMTPEQILSKLEISQILQDSEDPTVYYAEVIVYTSGNQTFIITV